MKKAVKKEGRNILHFALEEADQGVMKEILVLGSSAFCECPAEIDPILTEGHFISFQLGRCLWWIRLDG